MIINDALIEKIAKLAKLNLKDSDKKTLSVELSKILEHMELMNEVDVSQTEPMFHSCLEEHKLRGDEVESFDSKLLLSNVLEKKETYISVPNIIVEEEQ